MNKKFLKKFFTYTVVMMIWYNLFIIQLVTDAPTDLIAIPTETLIINVADLK